MFETAYTAPNTESSANNPTAPHLRRANKVFDDGLRDEPGTGSTPYDPENKFGFATHRIPTGAVWADLRIKPTAAIENFAANSHIRPEYAVATHRTLG